MHTSGGDDVPSRRSIIERRPTPMPKQEVIHRVGLLAYCLSANISNPRRGKHERAEFGGWRGALSQRLHIAQTPGSKHRSDRYYYRPAGRCAQRNCERTKYSSICQHVACGGAPTSCQQHNLFPWGLGERGGKTKRNKKTHISLLTLPNDRPLPRPPHLGYPHV